MKIALDSLYLKNYMLRFPLKFLYFFDKKNLKEKKNFDGDDVAFFIKIRLIR